MRNPTMPEPEFDPTALDLLIEDIGESSAHEVLNIFFKDAAEKIDLLSAIDGPGRLETITRHAHSLKSAAAAFGFNGITALARLLETEAADMSLEDIRTQVAALQTAVARAVAWALQ